MLWHEKDHVNGVFGYMREGQHKVKQYLNLLTGLMREFASSQTYGYSSLNDMLRQYFQITLCHAFQHSMKYFDILSELVVNVYMSLIFCKS